VPAALSGTHSDWPNMKSASARRLTNRHSARKAVKYISQLARVDVLRPERLIGVPNQRALVRLTTVEIQPAQLDVQRPGERRLRQAGVGAGVLAAIPRENAQCRDRVCNGAGER